MAIIAVIAEPLITVILTKKWTPSVYLLQILCIEGALYPLQVINLDILKVKGRSDLFLRIEFIKQFFSVIMILISCHWGVTGLVWGLVFLSCICYYINAYFSKALINYGFRRQIKDLIPFISMSTLLFILLYFLKIAFNSHMIQLIILPVAGFVLYTSISYIFNIKEILTFKYFVSTQFFRKKTESI